MRNQINSLDDFRTVYPGYGEVADNIINSGAKLDERILKAADILDTGDAGTYWTKYDGAKFWQQLNMKETNPWSLMPKPPWGMTDQADGFRAITALSDSEGTMLGEGGSIPDPVHPTLEFIHERPEIHAHAFGESKRGILAGNRGQGVKWEQLVKNEIDTYALQMATRMMKPIGGLHASESNGYFNSFDKVISSYDEKNNCSNDYTGTAITNNDVDLHSKDRHTAASAWDAVVSENGATDRPLTTDLLYSLRSDVHLASGEPKVKSSRVFIMSESAWNALSADEEGKHRIQSSDSSTPIKSYDFNGVKSVEGAEGGFRLSRFMTVPIVTSQHFEAAGSGYAPIYYVDFDYLKFWVDSPTIVRQYGVEQGQEGIVGSMKEFGLAWTAGQVVSMKTVAQGKLRDIA